jgi:hypothetical protein
LLLVRTTERIGLAVANFICLDVITNSHEYSCVFALFPVVCACLYETRFNTRLTACMNSLLYCAKGVGS